MSIEAAFVERLLSTAHRVEVALGRWLDANDLRLLEARLIRHMVYAQLDDCSCLASELARAIGISRQAASDVVVRLVDRRLVRFIDMSGAKDRRTKPLRLTEYGFDLGVAVDHLMADVGHELLGLLGGAERRLLREQLVGVAARARRMPRVDRYDLPVRPKIVDEPWNRPA